MLNKVVIYTLLIFLIFVAAGCGAKPQRQTGFDRRPDFGQPETPAALRGIVKSVTGNEVTIYKMAEFNREKNAASSEVATNSENRQSGGMMFGGGPGMGGGRRPEGTNDAETRAAFVAKIKEMSQGEEKFIVPVGIQMLKITSGDNGPQSEEASLLDIKADAMVQVWLTENTQNATFVLITE